MRKYANIRETALGVCVKRRNLEDTSFYSSTIKQIPSYETRQLANPSQQLTNVAAGLTVASPEVGQ